MSYIRITVPYYLIIGIVQKPIVFLLNVRYICGVSTRLVNFKILKKSTNKSSQNYFHRLDKNLLCIEIKLLYYGYFFHHVLAHLLKMLNQ